MAHNGTPSRRSLIGVLLQALRVSQWIKNAVVFAPLIFSGRLLERSSAVSAAFSFIVFCLASSGTYVLNDILDRRIDRFHPRKKTRPIASGALPVAWAWVLSLGLMGAALWGGWIYHPGLGGALLLYLGLNAAYSAFLKRVVILDVVILSLGFVIRIWGGSLVLGLAPSHWLQLTMWFLALFLGLAKRRQELVILHGQALRHRKVLSDYTPAFIDQLTSILTAVAILCYALYAVSPEVTHRVGPAGFIYTVPFVIYGIFRYLYVVHVREEALDPTEALLCDLPMALSLVAWILTVLFLLYR